MNFAASWCDAVRAVAAHSGEEESLADNSRRVSSARKTREKRQNQKETQKAAGGMGVTREAVLFGY